MTGAKEPKATSGVKFPPPAIYALLLGAGFLLGTRFPAEIWPGHAIATRVAGALLFAVGAALGLSAILTFRRAGTSPNPMRPTSALAVAGPYRFTRNPMYLGLAIGFAGFSVFWNALWPLLSVPLAMALETILVIAREERYLEGRFGEAYRGYKARVRRWI
jgi:protein-S-isoprenylcysteine O-methyltransferase Ste14